MKITKSKLRKIIKEELEGFTSQSGRGEMGQGDTNAAKGAAMALLDAAKAMEQAPSHEPASLYAKEVAKQANLIMDVLVAMGT